MIVGAMSQHLNRAIPVPKGAALPNPARLRDFVTRFAALRDATDNEARLLAEGRALLAELVAEDDWLPDAWAEPDPARYQQYLLHCDSTERFSVVSFVWGPGQATPVHDHQVWGLIGVLRGAEMAERYERAETGALVRTGVPDVLQAGEVDAVSPTIGDIHRVSNAYRDRVSISIHVYGANIGAVQRHSFDPYGAPKAFVSGYVNTTLPNIWSKA